MPIAGVAGDRPQMGKDKDIIENNFDAYTDDLSSTSHGLAGKLLHIAAPISPSKLKSPVK